MPKSYREASYGLGASEIQTIFKVTIPAAKSGILSAAVLGIGRAIGETMAVMMIAGIPPRVCQKHLVHGTSINKQPTLPWKNASGRRSEMLFATGVILFIFFIMIVNTTLIVLTHRQVSRRNEQKTERRHPSGMYLRVWGFTVLILVVIIGFILIKGSTGHHTGIS